MMHTANTFGADLRAYIAEYARPETRNWLETARLLGLRYHGDGEPEEAKGRPRAALGRPAGRRHRRPRRLERDRGGPPAAACLLGGYVGGVH
jgi:hypothetical protein